MKKMTCKQLGGACDMEFQAETFEEMSQLVQKHGMEMFQTGDAAHMEVLMKMQQIMMDPQAMQKFMDEKRQLFDSLPES